MPTKMWKLSHIQCECPLLVEEPLTLKFQTPTVFTRGNSNLARCLGRVFKVSSRFLSFHSFIILYEHFIRLYKHVVIWGKQNSKMSWPNSLKTVLVIDVIFVIARPSDIKLEIFNKTRSHGAETFIPVTPVCKSLWTCA